LVSYLIFVILRKFRLVKNNYFNIIFFLLVSFFFSLSVSAQDVKQQSNQQQSSVIEELNLYPNPVTTGKVYISTKNDEEKEITIFDLLGKKVLQTLLSSRELNVSNLTPGVYIIKINEGNSSATRKLIVR